MAAIAAAGLYWLRRSNGEPFFARRRIVGSGADGASADPTELPRQIARRVPRAEPIDLNEVVTQVREPLKRALPHNIRLRVDTRPGLPKVRADRGQLELMIGHLAANARDAMPEGGTITLRTYALSAAEGARGDDGVVLEIEDTGEGIDEALLPRILEPLSTAGGAGAGGGLRLGLPTVQTLAYHNHGTMRIESVPGGGTRVGIVLPRMRESSRTELSSYAARGKETILVVEDEDAVRSIVRRTLQAAGYTMLEAPDPLIALDILERRQEDVDLLLSDIVMHHMRGTELVRRVREQWPLVRVLYMSGYGRDQSVMEEVARDGAVLVTKPFTSEELLSAVRRALDRLPGPAELTEET